MKALTHIEFHTLLDIGAAEGYKAHVAEKIFNSKVISSDLSLEACKRSKEIFSIESLAADIHNIPFKDNAFDVVLCSETIEHVSSIKKPLEELLRVAKKAVIITVPHESMNKIEKNVINEAPHAHIHSFNSTSFDFLKESHTLNIIPQKLLSPMLTIPSLMIDAEPIKYDKTWGYPKLCFDTYNAIAPIFRKILGHNAASFMMGLDDTLCRLLPLHGGLLFTILKDGTCYDGKGIKKITAKQIMNITVPYHYNDKARYNHNLPAN